MGDSDDDYGNNNQSSSMNSGSGAGNHQNSLNSSGGFNNSFNKKNNNRDKFYRERDDSSSYTNNNNNNNNSNYNSSYNNGNMNKPGERRDWNNDRNRQGGDWKSNRNASMGGGYGNSGGYQRNQNSSSDYPRKYQHQMPNSPGGGGSGGGGHYDSSASSPPHKRNKKEWDSHMDQVYGPSSGYHARNPANQHDFQKSQNEPEYPTQPPFLSFKLFLQQQDDNISDEDAIKRYNEYKIDFRKTQVNNFYLEHKDEEWFKSRYHPDENYKRRNEQNQFVLNRLEVFVDMMKNGWLDDVSIEMDKTKEIIRFLDAFVIKLEGGNDQDIKTLLDGLAQTAQPESEDAFKVKIEAKEEPEEVKDEANEEEKADAATNGNGTNGDSSGTNKRKSADDSGSESGAYSDSDDNDGETTHKNKKKKSNSNKTSQASSSRQYHRTASIFMRNLAPSVTKQDLENLCKNHDGFKRVALSDPAPERGFFRRGWITFESHVDVKKICWQLQNVKVKECNPGAIVNRELTNRIRPINNLVSHHKSVVKNNIRLAMKMVQNMDKKWNLWQTDDQLANEAESNESNPTNTSTTTSGEKTEQTAADNENARLEEEAFSNLKSSAPLYLEHKFNGLNPLLENITDYLVDEINAEEEELLGDGVISEKTNTTPTSKPNSFDIDIDKDYNKVLDKLIIYLRVVHSIDFYNSIEYQQEDLMPNRCGIMFARPALPVNAASASLKINNEEINNYIQQFESKMKPYVEYKEKIDIELAKKLGLKDQKEEIEKFIKVNTQELAADRWLCPLSGKRFKGPEFIRKHLFYKHMEKITEVKKEVKYFNNYIFDPKRPQLPEHPSNKASVSTQGAQASTTSSGTGVSQSPSLATSSPSSYSNQMSNPNLMPNMLSPQMAMANQMGGYRQMNMGWQQGAYGMSDMMQNPYGGFNPSFGGQQMGGYYQGGFKKPGIYGNAPGGGGGGGGVGGGGYNPRRGRDSREMIQYKDLDAPEDA